MSDEEKIIQKQKIALANIIIDRLDMMLEKLDKLLEMYRKIEDEVIHRD